MSTLTKTTFMLAAALVVGLLLGGCARTEHEPSPAELRIEASAQMPAYLDEAFNAVGSRRAWVGVKDINAAAVVEFFQPDSGSYYLTRHNYRLRPWHNEIRVTANEPQGRARWYLGDKGFGGVTVADFRQYSAEPRVIAEAVHRIIAAPICLVEQTRYYSREDQPRRKQGIWYYAISKRTGSDDEDFEVIYYQNRSNSRLDWIELRNPGIGSYAVRGFEYGLVGQHGVFVPRLIEVYNIDGRGQLGDRILEIKVTDTSIVRRKTPQR